MRIVSRHRDYYDSARALGEDAGILYRRDTRHVAGAAPEVAALLAAAPATMGFPHPRHYLARLEGAVLPGVLVFCGVIHPFLALHPAEGEGRRILWTASETREALAGLMDRDRLVAYDATARGHRATWAGRARLLARNVEAFLGSGHRTIDAVAVHRSYGSPAVLCEIADLRDGPATTLDPVLADIGFQRILPPYEAHQRLATYLGGVLGTDAVPAPGISDADRAAKHGFDRWSFRRHRDDPRGA